jgi:hypothetical protein
MSDEFKSSVESAADSAASSAQQAGNAIQQGANEITESAQETASELFEQANEAGQDVVPTLNDAANSLGEALEDTAEESRQAGASAAQEGAGSNKNPIDDFVGEASKVGSQVTDQAKSIWESEERKDLQDAVINALTSVANAIEEQFKKIASTDESRKIVTKLEETTDKVVESVRSSKTAQDAADGILKGLQSAAASIEKWLSQQKSEPGSPAAPSSSNDAEDIPIVKFDE